MKAESSRGAETRLRIIRAAAELFHKQGAKSTSPDEIIEVSRTGKGQFYYYFQSKNGLVHQVLQHYLLQIEAGRARLNYEIDSWEELERWFLAHIEWQMEYDMTRGCPLGTIGAELTDGDDLIRQDLSLIFEFIKKKIAAFFIREKAQGRLNKDANEERMANFCIATTQGAMLMGKIKRDPTTAEAVVFEAIAHLKQQAVEPKQPVVSPM